MINNKNLKTLSTIGFAFAFFGLVALYLHGNLFSPSPIVITFQALSAFLMVWARITFGSRSFHMTANPTSGSLVTNGPYRFMRNPIYTAALVFSWAGIIAHFSVETVLLGILIFVGTMIRILCEEYMLRETYPEYKEYANKTRRLLPFIY